MNTYEIRCENNYGEQWCKHRYSAQTAGEAKYEHWLYMQDGIWEAPVGEVVKSLIAERLEASK